MSPSVKAGDTNTIERPELTLLEMAQKPVDKNCSKRHDYRDEAWDIMKKVCVEVLAFPCLFKVCKPGYKLCPHHMR